MGDLSRGLTLHHADLRGRAIEFRAVQHQHVAGFDVRPRLRRLRNNARPAYRLHLHTATREIQFRQRFADSGSAGRNQHGMQQTLLALCRVLDLIRQIQSELGISMIVVSHDLGVIRMLASRTLVMKMGRVVESGLTDQILEDPQHAYTQQLVASAL